MMIKAARLMNHQTREAWLEEAVDQLRGFFDGAGATVPPVVRVSTGWSRGAKPNSIGWCWRSSVADDSSSNIFVSPEIGTFPVQVLAVLLHELCHAADDCQSKHGGAFKAMWKYHGFVGKPTHSVPGEALEARLLDLATALGPYPHAQLTPSLQVKKQGTRMIKCECLECGYSVRTTQKWLDIAIPSCPVDEIPMTVA